MVSRALKSMEWSHTWAHGVGSCHVRINVSVRRGILWGISMHSIHKGEVLFFSSVYIWKAVNFFEVKVHVQKGPLRFVGKFDNRHVSFIHFMFSFIVVIWSWSLIPNVLCDHNLVVNSSLWKFAWHPNTTYPKHLALEFLSHLVGHMLVGVNPCGRCAIMTSLPQNAKLLKTSQNISFKICELIGVGILPHFWMRVIFCHLEIIWVEFRSKYQPQFNFQVVAPLRSLLTFLT